MENFIQGFTKNLKQRIDQHGKGLVESTQNWRPLQPVYYKACPNQTDATKSGKYFKNFHGRMFIKRWLESYLTV